MRRLVVLAVGAGLVLVGLPALAAPTAARTEAPLHAEDDALAVLDRAVRAGRMLDYRGTQYVASWQQASSEAALVEVTHAPGRTAVVREAPHAGRSDLRTVPTATLDPRHVQLLAASYDLGLAGTGHCTGRTTDVVEARRDDGQVAGRFWLDQSTGLLLRREVYDGDGRRLRSSAFVDLELPPPGRARSAALVVAPSGDAVAAAAVDLRDAGWHVPDGLPQSFRLYETRLSTTRSTRQVLHLAYSDGLSTTSLFAQPGRLGSTPPQGFRAGTVGGRPVWRSDEAPERVVWSGGGHVWTLVSDAPEGTVRAAVRALPRDPAPRDGVRHRLRRGVHRLAAALNPFD